MSRTDYPETWPGTEIIRSVHTPFNWRRPGDNPEPLNAGLIAALVPLLLLCLAVLIWAILPRRAPTRADRLQRATETFDAEIERQIATLRKSADHSVTHRPRVRANGCSQPPAAHIKAAPKPCGGGLCRHQANCADHHCPGRIAASLSGSHHAHR